MRLLGAALVALICVGCEIGSPATAPASTLANGGFDTVSDGLPAGWNLDAAVRDKGSVGVLSNFPAADGKVLELRPNARNGGDRPLGVGQLLDARPLRGKRITVQAILGADGAATAIVGVGALGSSGDLGGVQITEGDSQGKLVTQRRTLDIPGGAENLVVYAAVSGTSGRALFDSIAIAVDDARAPAAIGAVPQVAAAEVVVDIGRPIRKIPATLFGTNLEWIFDGQGLWNAQKGALDPEALRLARELAPTLIRFPGGGFSDYYQWRNGLGPQDKRPTTENSPKGPRSRHSIGVGEAAELARVAGAELLLTVNVGTGTAQEAADWVRYMNRGPGPRVRLWEVGNELYMAEDMSGGQLSAPAYTRKFLEFAAAMRAVDPEIRVGAIGGLNYGQYRFIDDSRWTETLLKGAAGQIDFLAVHNAYAPVVMGVPANADPRTVYSAMLAAPVLIENNLRDISRLLSKYEVPGRPIGIAVTEWGPLFHILPDNPWVDHVKTMGSALFSASVLNVFLREPRVEIANFFKLYDQSFMGWIGRRKGEWAPTASFRVFSLYRQKLGQNLVQAQVNGPVFSSNGLGVVSSVDKAPTIDAVATVDGETLTVIVVNKSADQPADVRVRLNGARGYGSVDATSVYADSLDANTGTDLPSIPGLRWARQVDMGRFAKGSDEEIHTATERLPGVKASDGNAVLTYRVRPLSVTSLQFGQVRR